MFIAIDTEGNRIDADTATKGNLYYCPTCHSVLRLRQGEQRRWHFAHETECADKWHYDMSAWHRQWQERFPVETREVIVKAENVIHRADILANGIVTEFQHSPMTEDEFRTRSRFYMSQGYNVIWLFDEIEHYKAGRFENTDKRRGFYNVRWKYPRNTFDIYFRKHNDNTQTVYIQLKDDESSSDSIIEVIQCDGHFLRVSNKYSIGEFIKICNGSLVPEIKEFIDPYPLEETINPDGWYTIQKLWDLKGDAQFIVVESQYGVKYQVRTDPHLQPRSNGFIKGYPPYHGYKYTFWSKFSEEIYNWDRPCWKYSKL